MKQLLYLKSGDRRAGICSYVQQVIHMAKSCKERNIPMHIDFSEHMLYYKDKQTTDNVWEYFFEQPFKDINLNDYEKEEVVWYHHEDPRTLRFEFRFKPDSEYLRVARQYCEEFVKLKPEMLKIGNNFITNNTNQNYLAVHKRGCDHDNASQFNLPQYFHETDKYIDDYEQLLVCSDEQFSIEEFKKRYGKKVICYDSARENGDTINRDGVHFKSNDDNFVYRNGRDCIIEAYLMSQAKCLLKTVSNVSHYAVMQNKNLNFIQIDDNYGCVY